MVTRRRKAQQGKSTIAVAYLRASTAEQLLGRDAERADVRRWAEANGVEIVAEYVDQGVSGGNELADRPALGEALEAVTRHRAGYLLVKDRTRLARDVVVAALLDREVAMRGARVVSADGVGNGTTPEDGFIRTIVDAASALHRMKIKANTKSALAAKKAKGERVSRHVPYGHRLGQDGVHLEPDPGEQVVIAAARALREQGWTYRAISEELEVLGHLTRNGHPFSVSSVYEMLT